MYKAIITDFDGTLANGRKGVCQYNIDAIETLISRGLHFAVCTGRMTASALKVVSALPFRPLVGSFNGSEITDSATGEKIFSSALSTDDCLPLIDYAISRDLNCQIYDDERVYPMRASVYTEGYGKSCLCEVVPSPNLKELIEKFGRTPKLMIIDEPSLVESLMPEITDKFGGRYEIARCYSGMIDFTPKGNNKGTVVSSLCKIWGIDESECVAIGDEFNDISMLEKAGVGVAVSNAHEEVKKHADYVTERNNDDGAVGEAIRKFLL